MNDHAYAGTDVRITSAEAIPLAYALTARVAADAGVRCLAIKGMVLAHHDLRAPRVSADVDVLVDPAGAETFSAAMTALGWRKPPDPESPRMRRDHAINLLNDHWPIGIDTHVYFPGFLAADAAVFEELWRRRIRMTLASQPVFATDLAGSAAIAALHHLRERTNPSNVSAFGRLVEKAKERMDADDLSDLSDLASATGSARTLAPLLEALSAPNAAEHPSEAAAWPAWQAASTAGRADVWRAGLRSTSWPQRATFLWRSFQPDEERLRQVYMRDVTTPLWRLRLRRTRYVLQQVPSLLRRDRRR